MPYNFLRDAKSVTNSKLCMYDTLSGYTTDFHENGNVDGWDLYNNIYLYGCWNGMIFGTAYDDSCYVSRSDNFPAIEAEDFYYVQVMMKVTNNNTDKVVPGLNTGRIQWIRSGDSVWNSTKQMDFDIIDDDKWHLYTVNMGPAQWWQGYITNLRVYPFIDGNEGDQFAIKFIKVTSPDTYACGNTSCSYHPQYSHPCPGAGRYGSCEAGVSKDFYTTISGVNDDLMVNIDGYGEAHFRLGNNENVNGIEMAKVLASNISSLNMGGYAYVSCEYSDLDKLKITSGTVGADSSVVVSGTAAEPLGFYQGGVDVSTRVNGADPATGFDYASARILTAREIQRLMDEKQNEFAYEHKPDQYTVEGGRRDFNEFGNSRLLSSVAGGEYYEATDNRGKTIIDYSHPFNNNGKLKSIYIYGKTYGNAKAKILRPSRDGSLRVIHSFSFPSEQSNKLYTVLPVSFRIDCDVLVNKGDLIGIYDADLYVGITLDGRPDATFAQINGEASGEFTPANFYSYGVGGFAIYARGDRWQTNTILDIDLGDKVNIEEVNIYGSESSSYTEFNIASCLDLSWEVELFGESHFHSGIRWTDGSPWSETHTNIGYGIDALDDGIRTPDNGRQGDTYNSGPNGMETYGHHSYFYVDGDAEWLYSHDCTGKTEYCWPYVPGSAWGPAGTTAVGGFVKDPIAFTLTFPYGYSLEVNKSIIYFKEANNFRNMALSTYLGSYITSGNADDNHYQLVPSYNTVRLDGILYEPDDGSYASDYVFNNPMRGEPRYTSSDGSGNPTEPSNYLEMRGALATTWNVIEHNFDPISCYGFRVYTDYHKSTKIMEMEVYVRMLTNASLADNITMSFSDYGEVWKDVDFEEISTSKLSAFLGGGPRYISIELESANEFSLNEIELLVGDQVKLDDCTDSVLLDSAPNKRVGESTAVEIENIYGMPFDLYIDIPREVSGIDDLIFWSKLGSQTELDSPEVGPSCVLHKNSDLEFVGRESQVACNDLAYGLKNLIDGKSFYTNIYDEDWAYTLSGTLSSGVSIDYCNEDRKHLEKSVFEFTDPPNVYEYWKVGIKDIDDQPFYVKDILPYYNGELVDIDRVYLSGAVGSGSLTYAVASGGFDIDAFHTYTFETDGDFEGWTVHQYNATGAGLKVEDGKLTVDTYGSALDTWYGAYAQKNVDPISDFIWTCNLRNYSNHHSRMGAMLFHFDDPSDTSGGIYITFTDSWVAINGVSVYLNNDSGSVWSGGQYASGDFSFTVMRSGGYLYFYFNNGLRWSGAWSDVPVTQVRMIFRRHTSYSPASELSVYDTHIYNAYGDGAAFGFRLSDGADLIDEVKIFHSNAVTSINKVALYGSNDNVSYDKTDGNGTISMNASNWYQRFAIDLQKRHDLDIIRNYGSATNKVFLSTSSNTDYSSSDVSDPEDVDWDNSTKDDGRWLRLNLLCGDDTTRCLRKVGVYPDISSAYCIGGGYNCEWHPLGTILSDYNPSLNVAYGCDIIANDYFRTWYPTNANDGIHTEYDYQDCWGFEKEGGVNPYIDLDFGQLYTVNKIVLYHGLDPEIEDYMNNDYDFYYRKSNNNTGLDVREYGSLVDSSTAKFERSIYFPGSTSSYLYVSHDDSLDFEFNDFMIDFWVNFHDTTSGTDQIIIQRGMPTDGDTTSLFAIWKNDDNTIKANFKDEAETVHGHVESTTTVVDDVWYHVAYVRDNNVGRIFINGIQEDNATAQAFMAEEDTGLFIGKKGDSTLPLYAYLEELRISTEATWSGSGNYDVPTSRYTKSDTDVLLIHDLRDVWFDLFSISGNSDYKRTHYFEDQEMRELRFEVTDFDTEWLYLQNEDGGVDVFNGSFLREIEVYTPEDYGYIDSETWPVVCMNLQDQFQVTGHDLINKDPNDTDTDWNNSETYFKYSDNIFEEPKKVAFTDSGSTVTQYSSSDSSGNMKDAGSEYVFDTNQYFDAVRYYVTLDTYDLENVNEISLRLEGPQIVDFFPDNISSGWIGQEGTIEVPEAGFYDVKAVQHLNPSYDWGMRYPNIYRATGLIKWVAVTRDTATNYSWDDDSDKYGKDYLAKMKIYAEGEFKPLEYHWWWRSALSTLSNDYLNVKTQSRSLKVEYPAASGVDTIRFRESDDFGTDDHFNIKDAFRFYWKIDDVDNLDTSYGDITFGVISDASPVYYVWSIDSLSLKSGWNNVRLKFEDATYFYPPSEGYLDLYDFLDEDLDFRNNGRYLKSFRIRYRGKGSPLTMNLDGLRIERNKFYDDVKFDKGLCLTDSDYLEIPLSSLTLEKGTIEFWLKPYTDTYGRNIFNDMRSRVLFTLVNNNNEIISLGIKSGDWFEPVVGNIRKALTKFNINSYDLPPSAFVDRNELVHIAMVWSNTGTDMENSDTVRLYMDGELICKSTDTWEVGDTKSAILKLGGATTQLAHNQDAYGSAIFDNVKIYNYCKSEFHIEREGVEKDTTYISNEFIEISKDNSTFYGMGSSNLPLVYESVPHGEKRTVYMRTNKDERFINSKKTANLLVEWLISV